MFYIPSPSKQRFTFSVNDFVRYREGLIGRIEGVFILNLSGLRAFFKLQEVDMIEGTDPVLNLPRYRPTHGSVIVGLPNIMPVRVYMVPVIDAGQGLLDLGIDGLADEFLLVTWDVEFL